MKCKLCNNEVTCHGELCEECADKNLIKIIKTIMVGRGMGKSGSGFKDISQAAGKK